MENAVANRASSGRVEEARVCKAVDALLKMIATHKSKQKLQLLEDDMFLYLMVSLQKIPERERTNPYRIPLPHPIFALDGSHEVCLIVNDREEGVQPKETKQKILQEGLSVAKVMGITKLKNNYFSFETKRKLCGSYDLFLADDRILRHLPKLLGKEFFRKKKHPIAVKLNRAKWKNQLQAACNSTFLYVRGGTCSVLKVARISQKREEMIENIMAAIEGVVNTIPKKWKNIRAIYLRSLESLALPLYQAVPEMPLRIESGKRKSVTGAEISEVEPKGFRKENKKKKWKRYIDAV